MPRRVHSSDLVRATWGCERCTAGGTYQNAQAVASQHHDKTRHRCWVETTTRINYGTVAGKKGDRGEQRDLLR